MCQYDRNLFSVAYTYQGLGLVAKYNLMEKNDIKY